MINVWCFTGHEKYFSIQLVGFGSYDEIQFYLEFLYNQEERYKEEVSNASIALERCQDEDNQNCSLEE